MNKIRLEKRIRMDPCVPSALMGREISVEVADLKLSISTHLIELLILQ